MEGVTYKNQKYHIKILTIETMSDKIKDIINVTQSGADRLCRS